MLAPLMEPEGSGPNFRGPRQLHGPAITATMAGANTCKRLAGKYSHVVMGACAKCNHYGELQ